jgi:hypothetical protein
MLHRILGITKGFVDSEDGMIYLLDIKGKV